MQKNFFLLLLCCWISQISHTAIADETTPPSFLQAKTIFQTDQPYDSRIGIAADAAIVHRHSDNLAALKNAIGSWQQKGYCTGRMFFVDSDGANDYWTGKWDSIPHPNDVELDIQGQKVMCDIRPYMVPTKGWTSYLKDKTEQSLNAGALAILPEEPLAHTFAGYSEGFKQLWQQHYKSPWQPQHQSSTAGFLTSQLKAKLYLQLECDLVKTTQEYNNQHNKDVSFVLPIHSIFSNISAQLVAPLGLTTKTDGIDGYIGQIWTGPVNWALANYDSPDKSFFCSAYALYDYFTQLTVATDKKLWLLIDPVEDNPKHQWDEFATWYHHCATAMLLMPRVNMYEIMPWPDRIFLPGYGMGGGTPAPENFRITALAITQVLQDMPLGGQWLGSDGSAQIKKVPAVGIAVAIADSAMWQKQTDPKLQGIYGMLLPLISRGIPVSSFVMERAQDKHYTDLYKVIVLSYENFKPVKPEMNVALAEWVKQGGVLVLLGNSNDKLDNSDSFWWQKLCYHSPMHHLLEQLGKAEQAKGQWAYGKGFVIRNKTSSRELADPKVADRIYLPLIDQAVRKSGLSQELKTPGYFCMKRGPFVIAHAMKETISLEGKFIDIFDENLPLVNRIHLASGESGLFRDVTDKLKNCNTPMVLQTTHRLISQEYKNDQLLFTLNGPAETPAVARLFLAGRKPDNITAVAANGKKVDISIQKTGESYKVSFPNDPDGITVSISCPVS